MAAFSASLSLFLLFLSVSSPAVHGNSAPAVECSSVILNLAKCLSFVTIGSTVDKPDGSCCSGLKTVLDTSPECLCEGLKNSGHMGIKLNVTKASTLPVACKLTAPPVSSCGLSTTTPTTAPTASVPAAGSKPGSGSASAPIPGPSQKNDGFSLIPVSGLSLVISGALVILFSHV